ncbi:MAG: DUF2089 family protein [Pseudomonadales bacterium]|nr:DUF2089 family protein [Pseudomonadales bacterium]
MRTLSTHVACPACETTMVPRVVECPSCQLRIEAHFKDNEFSRLPDEWLHFLRIFVHCEGRIRDMEAALGVSYPTIKSRVAELKTRLGNVSAEASGPPAASASDAEANPDFDAVLRKLEAGEIDYDSAMAMIEALRAR